jgi:hypothetical protein
MRGSIEKILKSYLPEIKKDVAILILKVGLLVNPVSDYLHYD